MIERGCDFGLMVQIGGIECVPIDIRRLFARAIATEIAVPYGEKQNCSTSIEEITIIMYEQTESKKTIQNALNNPIHSRNVPYLFHSTSPSIPSKGTVKKIPFAFSKDIIANLSL